MNLKVLKAELDRTLDYLTPLPIGFAERKNKIITKINKTPDKSIVYKIIIK